MADNDMTVRQLYDLFKKAQDEQTEKLTKAISKSSEEFNKKIEEIEGNTRDLKNKYLNLERRIRKNNIIIFGLKTPEENIVGETVKTLNTLLEINLNESHINNIYSIGSKKQNKGIVVQFVSYLSKISVFKNVSKLRNKNITIANDLCIEDQQVHKILIKHLKIAKSNNKKARLRGYKLEIEGRLYGASELEREVYVSDCDSDVLEEGEEESGGSSGTNLRKQKKITKIDNKHITAKKTYSESQINTRLANKNCKK